MEFNFEPITLGIAGVLYAVVLILIWVFNAFMMSWDMPIKIKIILSLFMLPITYLIVIKLGGD